MKRTLNTNSRDDDAPRRLSDEDYEYVFKRAVRFCIDFAIVKDGGILLAKRDIEPYKGYWSLPGGMVRRKESIDDATERILRAELGLGSVQKNLAGYTECINDGPYLHSNSIVFLTVLEPGFLRGSEQAEHFKFFRELPEDVHPIHGGFLKRNWNELLKEI
jgi:ADP-ribose pyrophosphatase YjhB (NUDIX family)